MIWPICHQSQICQINFRRKDPTSQPIGEHEYEEDSDDDDDDDIDEDDDDEDVDNDDDDDDKDNDEELGTVSQLNSVQTFQRYVKDKSKYIIDVGSGTGLVGLQLKKLGYKNFDGVVL